MHLHFFAGCTVPSRNLTQPLLLTMTHSQILPVKTLSCLHSHLIFQDLQRARDWGDRELWKLVRLEVFLFLEELCWVTFAGINLQ